MRFPFWWLCLAGLWGCSPAPPAPSVSPTAVAAAVEPRIQRMEAKRAGQLDFRVEKAGQGLKIQAGGQEWTAKVESDRIKLFGAGEKLAVKVKRKDRGFEVEDGAGGRLLRAKIKPGPSIQLEDGSDRLVLQLEERSGTLQLASGESIRKQGETVVLLDKAGQESARLEGGPLAAGLVLALPAQTAEQRAALAIYLTEVGP